MQTLKRETPDIETSTDDYARRFSGPVGTWLLDVQWDAIHKLLRNCPGQQVLEIGGGHAQLTGSLLDHGYHVTVMGSDESCAHRLKPFIEPGRCAFHTGDLLNLPYEDNSFDTVIAIRLMAHVEDWPRFLSEAARVARHAVIIDYPSLISVNRVEKLLFGLKKALEGNTRHYQCFTTKMIRDACASTGVAPCARQRQFFWPMVVHRAMKMPKVSRALERTCRAVGLTYLLGSPVILKLARTEPTESSSAATLAAAIKLLFLTNWG
ncbi:MAG: class I SAM-dependent methyltransferase [Phycisphaerales bacterium]